MKFAFKHIIPGIIVFLLHNYSFAQSISIHFAYLDSVLEEKDTLAPYLQINYINNSEKDYYFPALVSSHVIIPRFLSSLSDKHLGYNDLNYIKDALYDDQLFHGEEYQLLLDFQHLNNQQSWFLLPANYEEETEEPIINYYLSVCSKGKDTRVYYTRNLLRCSRQLRKCSSLLFLKAGAKETQLVSLHGIKDTGIIITVSLCSRQSPTCVMTGYRNKDVMILPSRVYGYLLYDGDIDSNSLCIDFSNK